MDVVLLSRIQFGVTIMFHYLYPPLTIGLGLLLVIMEGTFLWTKNPVYEAMTKFWVKIFALNFAIGVATGIVMEFQFGTNWSTYSRYVGDVFGSALAAEGVFAFFLESGFLAILVFGWDKVSPRVHFFSTLMVSLGSMFSAIWIVVANSWMQTPAGHHIVDTQWGPRAEITDFWAMVFNPSSVVRLSHTLVGSFILAAFFVMSISAYYLIRNRHVDFARRCFVLALVFGGVSSLAQLGLGHWSAVVVAEHQPAKLAAFEGIFGQEEEAASLHLFGVPSIEERRVKYGVAIPGMLSFLVHGDWQTPVAGLGSFPREDWPPVNQSFQSYHLMIACGMYFIAITLVGLFLFWRGTLFKHRWLLWVHVFSVVLPYISNQAGWYAAEVGRQPWIVYGLMRTSDGVSRVVSGGSVLASLIMFMLVYILLFVLFIYVLDRKIRGGPETPHLPEREDAHGVHEAMGQRGKTGHGMADLPGEVDA